MSNYQKAVLKGLMLIISMLMWAIPRMTTTRIDDLVEWQSYNTTNIEYAEDCANITKEVE